MRFHEIINETSAPLTVYHGGSGPLSGAIRVPFFTTPHREMARSYAAEKGRGDGRLWSFELSRGAKIASLDDLEQIADELAIDWEGAHPSDLLYQDGDYDDYDVPGALRSKGYDAVFLHDFGYHDDFSEEPTYIILNPTVLSNGQEVERVASRK